MDQLDEFLWHPNTRAAIGRLKALGLSRIVIGSLLQDIYVGALQSEYGRTKALIAANPPKFEHLEAYAEALKPIV